MRKKYQSYRILPVRTASVMGPCFFSRWGSDVSSVGYPGRTRVRAGGFDEVISRTQQ